MNLKKFLKADGRTDYLTKAIKVALDKRVQEAKPYKYFRASRFYDECPRFIYFCSKLEKPIEYLEPFSFNTFMAMENGTAVHSIFQGMILGPMGVLKGNWKCSECDKMAINSFYPEPCCCGCPEFEYVEYEVYDEATKVKGHIDGLVCLNRLEEFAKTGMVSEDTPENLVHLEIKTTGGFSFKDVVKGKELPKYYSWQANIYQKACFDAGLIKEKKTMFLYQDRDSLSLHSFIYPHDEEIVYEVQEKSRLICNAIVQGVCPDSFKCASIEDDRAKFCPFRKECFK